MSVAHCRIFFYVSESGKPRVSESRGNGYFYYAERKRVQAHEVCLKRKTPLIALCALEPASARCATCK